MQQQGKRWLVTILINIMLPARSKAQRNQAFPTSRAYLEKRRQELVEYNRKFVPRQSPTASKRPLSTAPASPTREPARPELDSRLKSSRLTAATSPSAPRPTSTTPSRCHHRSASPLSVIRTRSKCLSPEREAPLPARPIRTDFLRKGSAVDRTIIRNVLMSKLSTSGCRPAFSYSSSQQNAAMRRSLEGQIPLGLGDVVGTEEMLRMSHILLGVELQTASLSRMVGAALEERRNDRKRTATEEEESPMLRSIKRW